MVVRRAFRAAVAALSMAAFAGPGRAEEPASATAATGAASPQAAPGSTGPSGAAAAPAPDPDALVAEVTLLPYNRHASYGARRISGPTVNVTQAAPDQWKGNVRDFDGVFTVTAERISAANLNIVVEQEKDGFVAQGLWDGKRVRIAFTPEAITARVDTRFYEMERVGPDIFGTKPQGPALRVKGDAAGARPLYPQLILALLAVL